jgi:superfamily II DNA/RNA helicase
VGQRHLELGHVQTLVLDEADKMLDLGFLPDVERILQLTPDSRQTMMFSATMPGEVVTLARRHLSRPMHIRAEQHDEPAHVPSTQQFIYRAHQMDKIEVLARVLQAEGRGLSIVFCRTKRSADQVSSALTTRGFAAGAVHGDLGQGQRERAMRAFRTGKVDVLVATEVAARGLDVDDVTHVVNYECPEDEKAYLHRIGRTGRAGRTGVAVTFVDWADTTRWKVINDTLNLGHPEPAETYSTSEHLFTELSIPAGTTGTLPRSQRARAGLEAEQLEDIGETGKTRSRSPRPDHGRGRAGDSPRRAERSGGGADQAGFETGPRTPRVRRRTRSGVQVSEHGGSEHGGAEHSEHGVAEHAGAHARGEQARGDQPGGSSAGAATPPARRRRRRSSRGRGPGTGAAGGGAASARPDSGGDE